MGIEIERKYLVKSDGWRHSVQSTKMLRQGYLCTAVASGAAEVRVRCGQKFGFVTIKGAGVLVRSEFEYEIPLADAEVMLAQFCGKNVLEKRRHSLIHADALWEVDEYLGLHKGLILAEIELSAPNQPVDLPSWIGREVTEDPRFRNAYLAANPGFSHSSG